MRPHPSLGSLHMLIHHNTTLGRSYSSLCISALAVSPLPWKNSPTHGFPLPHCRCQACSPIRVFMSTATQTRWVKSKRPSLQSYTHKQKVTERANKQKRKKRQNPLDSRLLVFITAPISTGSALRWRQCVSFSVCSLAAPRSPQAASPALSKQTDSASAAPAAPKSQQAALQALRTPPDPASAAP